MTAYRFPPDSEVAPDGPVLSDTAVAFRDNLLAVIEGDPTAPKIAPAAMLAPTAGATIIWRSYASLSGSGTSGTVPESEVHVLIAGTVRVTFDYIQSGGTKNISVYKNNTVVLTETLGGGSASIDVAVALGDSIYISVIGSDSYTITNYRIKSGVSTAAIA